ncbi:hypothetical protein B0H12DRAFT_1101329 [Mycena haematopus]|nr:hypothetical protein B0H12DRAFT_1101329 [Mycena haematopus]
MPSHPQRLPAERARHGKRLPLQGWPDAAPLARQNTNPFTLTGPITITQIIPNNTPAAPPVTTSSATNLPPASAIIASSSPSTPLTAPISPPTALLSPVASAIGPKSSGTENAQVNSGVSVPSQHGLPTGAIVGITIACVMLILGAFVFLLRQRAVRNRKLRQQTAPWLGAPNSSYASAAAGAGGMNEASPGASFARAQQAALARPAVPAPVPMPVPPTAYNNPPAPAGAGGAVPTATVRYEFIPSLPDELSITTGEVVRVVAEYDDGWALCKNARGDQGMVPLECLDRAAGLQIDTGAQDYRNSRRTSSLRPAF